MKKYVKRPIVIEAMQWTGFNYEELMTYFKYPTHLLLIERSLYIVTLEGRMRATPGDYIIKGIAKEFYPCKPSVFIMTYEEVKEPE